MHSDKYILVGTHPQRCADQDTWLRWYKSADRHVAVTAIEHAGVIVTVISQFLGVDESRSETAMPSLFETCIFGGPLDREAWRAPSWRETLNTHARAVQKVTAALMPEGQEAV